MTWWVLTLTAIAAVLVGWLLWLYFHGRRIRNRGRGWLGPAYIGESRATARLILPPAVEIVKRVCNITRTPPESRAWFQRTEAGVGDTLQFRIECRNGGYTPIPAQEIRISDEPQGPGEVVPGSGLVNIGGGEDIPLSDELLNQLFTEMGIRLSDIPDAPAELPARTSVYVRYKVRASAEEAEEEAGPEAGGGPPPD